MDDPISVAARVTSLLSLDLYSIEYFYRYYTGYRHQRHDLAHTADRLGDLLHLLRIVNGTVRSRPSQPGEQAAVQTIERSIACCDDVINELGEEVQRFKSLPVNASSHTVSGTSRRAVYPLRESTLKKLDEDIAEFHSHLSMPLQALSLREYQVFRTNDEFFARPMSVAQDAAGRHGYQDSHVTIDGHARVHIGGTFIQNDMKEMEDVVKDIQVQDINAGPQQWLRVSDATSDFDIASAKRHTARDSSWFEVLPLPPGCGRPTRSSDCTALWAAAS